MDNIFPQDGQEQIRILIRHFVPLTWMEIAKDSSRAYARVASGFVIAVKGEWVWITAGHVIRDIEHADSRDVEIRSLRFFDLWEKGGITEGDEGIPVEFQLGRWFSVFDDKDKDFLNLQKDGKDYGGVLLNTLERENMKISGIVPLDEGYWRNIPKPNPTGVDCVALGVPDETTDTPPGVKKGGRFIISATVNPVLVPIRFEDGIATEDMQSKHPRLIGRLLDEFVHDKSDKVLPLNDLCGMSGGPVFWVRPESNEQARYYAVGIQSGFFQSERTVTCCHLIYIAETIESIIEDFEKEPG